MKAIALIMHFPQSLHVLDKNKFVYIKDTSALFYYKDSILFRLRPTFVFETDAPIPGTAPYFIYKQTDSVGFLFRSKDARGIKLKLDSFLAKNMIRGDEFYVSYYYPGKLGPVIKKEGQVVVETFYGKQRPGRLRPDSASYYFTNALSDIPYTFSKKLDSSKGMRLYKVRLFSDSVAMPDKTMFPPRNFLFEYGRLANYNKRDVIQLFHQFSSRLK